jgi:hypothetical protein
LDKKFIRKEQISPKEMSWETTEEDERRGVPYPLWKHPDNVIQDRMWSFTNFCLQIMREYTTDKNFKIARARLDRGLVSCAWWWMSGRKIGPFSPVSWHPSETKKSLDEMIESIRLLSTLPWEITEEAERVYESLVALIFETHERMKQEKIKEDPS